MRWRAFADAVAFALGINMWVSVVMLPALFVGTWQNPLNLALAALPLVVLLAGLWRRSETILLLVYPSVLLLPIAVSPEMASPYVYSAARFAIVAVGLVAFLMGISFFASFYEHPEPASTRPLASSRRPQPARWRRRYRVYWALTLLSVVFPLTLLYVANFDTSTQAFLRQMYPNRVAQMTTVLNLLVLVAWVLIYAQYFVGVLRLHRTGDVPLAQAITDIRVSARRPRPAFFIAVILAVVFMALLLISRYV
ncbi:MAG: hypothetical protein Tsb0020_26500 [Haliangiales bacterium]